MGSVWSTDQVLALAPDAASAKSGKELAAPRKWVTLGAGDELLWGECQGSGSKPYQTRIHLTEPAFHCSCPSRKFPCKHSLGLFLLWINQPALVSPSPPPAWVSSWLESRLQREDKKAKKEQEKREVIEKPVDAAAAAKRESARRNKVEAGLEDLALWLSDLIRHGLTSLQGKPGRIWEEQSRRLIDAQAPGLARRLRMLEALPLSGERWQETVLERLGPVHLAIEGFRRIQTLPPDLQAELRGVIGVPVDQDAVRAGEGIRDDWRVIGQRVEIEDGLKAQRTWLIGRESKRPALVLDFAHGSQPLDTSMPPGTHFEGTLAFFPGSAPLRALVQNRLSPLEPLPTPPSGSVSIEEGRDAYARILALNPWIELFPIVLEGVRLVRWNDRWIIVDGEGSSVPVSPRFQRGWHVLARTAGRAFLVAGEYDGTHFEPLACWIDGRFVSLPAEPLISRPTATSPIDSPPSLANLWRDASASALVGVERRPLPARPQGDSMATMVSEVAAPEPTRHLLNVSAAASLYGRVGRRLAKEATPIPEACPDEEIPECPGPIGLRLERILGEKREWVVPEWAGLCQIRGVRIPSEHLPEMLGLAKRTADFREPIRSVLGTRGRWLASVNPEWGFLGGQADTTAPETVWQTGSRAERVLALKTLRARDAAKARELVASTWGKDSADDRAAFVGGLETGLSMEDEPFLEAALDDRGKTVRRAAADLLARLPESRLSQRMSERASRFLQWRGDQLEVLLPDECDKAMLRDGVDPKPARGIGERAWWLLKIIEATPTAHWPNPPSRLIASLRGTEWHELIWAGWAVAATRLRDASWASALLADPAPSSELTGPPSGEVVDALSADERQAYFLRELKASSGRLGEDKPIFYLLRGSDEPFGVELSREILRRVSDLVAIDATREALAYDYEARGFIESLAWRIAPELCPEAERAVSAEGPGNPYYGQAYSAFLDGLRFRHEMHQEFPT